MTVCIATMHRDQDGNCSVITASDRRISLYGGYFSQDGTAVKFTSVHPDWLVMFAGDASEAVPLLESIATAMKGLKRNTRADVVKKCRLAYMHQRRRMIETQILPDYDIENYAEFAQLKKADPEFHLKISAEIGRAEESWSLLFAGFDSRKLPHLFIISERGKVTYCNIQQFAAIGSGALAASVYLATYPYKWTLSLGESVFATCAAKFFAVAASDVGPKTLVTLMRPQGKIALVVRDDQVKNMLMAWEQLPKIPTDFAIKLTEQMVASFAEVEFMARVAPSPPAKIVED